MSILGSIFGYGGNEQSPASPEPSNSPQIDPDRLPSSGIIPESILAFRTITTLLSDLQQTQKVLYEPPKLTNGQRRELKVSDAFAHLAVGNRDVIALSTHHEENLKILASTGATVNTEAPDQTEAITPQNWYGWLAEFPRLLLGRNGRFDDMEDKTHTDHELFNPTALPIIIKAEAPIDENGKKVGQIEVYVEALKRRWTPPKLSVHLWILGEMITLMSRSIIYSETLMEYTIAVCHPKMLRRFKNPLSVLCIQTLNSVKDVDIPEVTFKPTSPVERRYDHNFMVYFIGLAIENEWKIPKIPELRKIYEHMPIDSDGKFAKPDNNFTIYTNETRLELHNLLIYLLTEYRKQLQALQEHLKSKPSSDIKEFLLGLYPIGLSLSLLARGDALQFHLQNIEASLCDIRSSSSISMILQPTGDQDSSNDQDDAFDAIKRRISDEGSVIPKWTACRDWVRLMTVHFDAADILRRYVSTQSHFHPISVEILVDPAVDNDALPWDRIFDSTFFPDQPKNLVQTNAYILAYIKEAALLDDYISLLSSIEWPLYAKDMSEIGPIQRKLGQVDGLGGELGVRFFNLRRVIRKFQSVPARAVLEQIGRELDRLFDDLVEKEETCSFPFKSRNVEFSGTLHCEASLASIMHPGTREIMALDPQCAHILQQTQGFGHVIGVSKRSCPACQLFLNFLSKTTAPFITGSYHTTLTACTLPAWTPEEIVTQMNLTFGILLRDELIDYIKTANVQRRRAKTNLSTNSRRLSSSSLEPDDIGALVENHKARDPFRPGSSAIE